jgi:hypothetical protein
VQCKTKVNWRVISDTISDDPNLSDLHTSFVSLNQLSSQLVNTHTDRGSGSQGEGYTGLLDREVKESGVTRRCYSMSRIMRFSRMPIHLLFILKYCARKLMQIFFRFVSLPPVPGHLELYQHLKPRAELEDWSGAGLSTYPSFARMQGLQLVRRAARVRGIRWWFSCVSVSLSFKIFFHLTLYWRTYFTFSCSIHFLANDHLAMTHTTTSPCSCKTVHGRCDSLAQTSACSSSLPLYPLRGL